MARWVCADPARAAARSSAADKGGSIVRCMPAMAVGLVAGKAASAERSKYRRALSRLPYIQCHARHAEHKTHNGNGN